MIEAADSTDSTDPAEGRERTLNEAQRLVAARFEEPGFLGFQCLRMNYSGNLWIVVTSPAGATSEFKLEPGESAHSFADRVLSTIVA